MEAHSLPAYGCRANVSAEPQSVLLSPDVSDVPNMHMCGVGWLVRLLTRLDQPLYSSTKKLHADAESNS